jgi:hypothetical protein
MTMTQHDDREMITIRQHTEAAADPSPDTHLMQSLVEGVEPASPAIEDEPEGQYVEFKGRRFRMAASIGLMPLLRFAHLSRKGLDSADMEGLAAMYAMIRDCIDTEPSVRYETDARTGEEKTIHGPSEWDRFEDWATESKASDTDLFGMVNRVIEVISARPTEHRSESSTGSRATPDTPKGSSGSAAPAELGELVPVVSLLGP